MEKFTCDEKLRRSIEIETKSVDSESRVLEFSFSSEKPYERSFGLEIISHEDGAMNLERLNSAAPILFNHDWDKQIGVIEKAWVGEDKRGYVRMKFGRSAYAQEKMQDVEDGILKGVSFGYMIDEMILSKKAEKGEIDEYTVTKLTPFEVSLVTVPADVSVGVGRSIEIRKLETKTAVQTAQKGNTMDEIQIKSEAVKAERERIAGITALGEKLKQPELARQLVEGGKTLDEARAAFLEKMGLEQKPVSQKDGEMGLSEKEVKQFSFVRAFNALANPQDRKAWEAAGYEREVSEAAQKQYKREARGIMVPVDVLRSKIEQRDLLKNTVGLGGNLIATELLPQSFIEILRVRSVLQRAGAQSLNGLVGDIAVPRATGAATAYWVGEAAALTESQQAFDQVKMAPKTVGAFVDISRKMLLQSSIDVEAFVRNDLAAVIALEIDRVGLYGSGSMSQPMGVNALVGQGLNTVDFAADAPTFTEIVSMESEIAADNADEASMAYLVNARGRGVLKTAPKFGTGTEATIWEPGNTVNGYRVEVSNQVRTPSGVQHDYWFGAWQNLIMGFWSGLDLMVDPYNQATSGTVRIIAMQDLDIMVRRPEYFCKGSNNP